MFFALRMGLSTLDEYRTHMDVLDLSTAVMTPYVEHRVSCPFERVSLYLGWLRYGNHMVKYLSERVLHQFGYVQTVPRHPLESAPPKQTLGEITLRFQRALDYALTTQQLGHRALYGVEALEGYIHWFYDVSHPRMILPDMEVLVPRPPEREAIDEIAAHEDGDHGYLELRVRLGPHQRPCVCCYVKW